MANLSFANSRTGKISKAGLSAFAAAKRGGASEKVATKAAKIAISKGNRAKGRTGPISQSAARKGGLGKTKAGRMGGRSGVKLGSGGGGG